MVRQKTQEPPRQYQRGDRLLIERRGLARQLGAMRHFHVRRMKAEPRKRVLADRRPSQARVRRVEERMRGTAIKQHLLVEQVRIDEAL